MPDDRARQWRDELENLHRLLTSPGAKAQFAEMGRQIEAILAGQMLPPDAKAQLAEFLRKIPRLRLVDVDQIPPPRTRKQSGRTPFENSEVIARGVELARANGGNFSQAGRDLYAELHPRNPRASRTQQSNWEAERARFANRVRHHIADQMRGG
jgi:hypothetical protein